jgi:intracellular septation protein A
VAMFNKIALGFVVFFSVCMIINTYLGEAERVQSNAVYFILNGFAYVVSALEMEKEKEKRESNQSS